MNENRNSTQKLERILALVSLFLIGVAWFIGSSRAEASLEPHLVRVFPNAGYFKLVDKGLFAAYESEADDTVLGYVAAGTAQGYGGELKILAAINEKAIIAGVVLVGHNETQAFMTRVLKRDIIKSFAGKAHADTFSVGKDVDGVSGATLTCRALADAVKQAVRLVAVNALGLLPVPDPQPEIRFGAPEILLILLFLVGFVGSARFFPFKKTARWASLLTGLIFLGFVYNIPLTLVTVNKMLLGFWPQWRLYLYWYLLAGGVLFALLVSKKNSYCDWFCPFGAAQECLAVIGGGKLKVKGRFHRILRWLPRVLALAAIVVALIYRNPGISSYEVFGAFFQFVGSTFLFALLALVLILSLFVRRPWCAYLCPIRPVTDFIRIFRTWFLKS